MEMGSKRICAIIIAIILVAAAVLVVLPDPIPAVTDADLLFVHESDAPVGSVYISYTKKDGSDVTTGSMNADSSLLERGDDLQFDGVEWPVTVTVCSDLQGREKLTQVVVEEAPAEGWLWRVVLVDSAAGPKLVVTDAAKG